MNALLQVAPDVTPRELAGAGRVVFAGSYLQAVDLYWNALSYLQNAMEDIDGAEGRLEYLRALGLRVVALLQRMDAIVNPDAAVGSGHEVAFAFENGLRSFGLTAAELIRATRLQDPDVDADTLAESLTRLAANVVAWLPGQVPEAQGTSGQRQIIRAMRDWSTASEALGLDISFLAQRLEEL